MTRSILRLLNLGLVAAAAASAAAPRAPNILFIFSDDHAYQAISAYGEGRRLLETPHLDRLAKSGMRFDRALVPNSICGPSRAVVLTGKYNHLNGFVNNSNSRFDGSQVTFPKILRQAGYQTAVIGKWHLVSDPTGFDFWHILPGQALENVDHRLGGLDRRGQQRAGHRHHVGAERQGLGRVHPGPDPAGSHQRHLG